jgi:putative hemolysin
MPSRNVTPSQSGNVKSFLPIHGLASKFIPWRRLEELNSKVQRSESVTFRTILDALEVVCTVVPADLARIPKSGAVVVVANHPFGILDGLVAGDVISSLRPDTRILTNFILSGVPYIADRCIFVDPFGTAESVRKSQRGLREAIEWLRSGGVLVVFPAGEVSHWKLHRPIIVDPKWSTTAARLARMTGASVLPVHFEGHNSLMFQTLGVVHPKLRTLSLPGEFVRAAGKSVKVQIGSPISAGEIRAFPDEVAATKYMRWRTYFLRKRGRERRPGARVRSPQEPIAPATSPELVINEIAALPPEACVARGSGFCVYAADAQQAPSVVREIGRLREITFRAAGEGSGLALDLDEYDDHYKHLFVWDPSKQQIVGAYRFGDTTSIIASHGVRGLYTSTLFKFGRGFFDRLGPALELGRSFVCQEYQRQYAPLLMLWKGLATYVCHHPATPVLFGAVSMSSEYNRASRELLVRFFKKNETRRGDTLSSFVTPRAPFRVSALRNWEMRSIIRMLNDVEALNAPIADIERDGKELPILLKQYLKLGGSVLAFNVDRNFSNVLDALITVDLRNTRREVLARYMTAQGVDDFFRFHADLAAKARPASA